MLVESMEKFITRLYISNDKHDTCQEHAMVKGL